jgi:vancomycin resistance protein VanJ
MASRWRRAFHKTVTVLAVAYPAALLATALLLRFAGEDWWVSGVALYLPRFVFGLPLPLLALLLALARRRRLLALQGVSLFLWLFPLMGLTLGWPGSVPDGAPSIRVLSYNVNSGWGGFPKIADEVNRYGPDVALFVELPGNADELRNLLAAKYPHFHTSTQFAIASRFPIRSAIDPERLGYFGAKRSPRYMRYEVDTSLGPVTFYLIHPVSPRGSFHSVRGQGLRKEILSGRLFAGTNARDVQETSGLRMLQVRTVAERAAAERGPTVIAGDSNLPYLSPTRARYLGRFRDGFGSTRVGFGYTYPTKLPWMRIDLISSNDQLDFSGFQVGESRDSDHLCVVADLFKTGG